VSAPIRVAVTNPETGETTEVRVHPGDYYLLAAPPLHLADAVAKPDGTIVLTLRLRGARRPLRRRFRRPSGGGIPG
jgi:hypothetical protein